MFKLFTGGFRTLELQLVQDLLTERDLNPLGSLLVLIPTGRLRTHLQHALARKKAGLLNIHFLTFFGLAEQILVDGPATNDRLIGEAAFYRELIQHLLEGKTTQPLTLRKDFLGAGEIISRGLPGALAGTLKDLRDAGVRVTDALKAALEGHLGAEASSAAPTLELYARVYDLLQKMNVRTPSDFLRRAADHAPKSTFLKNQKAVFIYGFYDMTGVQLDLTRALIQHENARVYFPYEKNNFAYAFAEKLLNDPVFFMPLPSQRSSPVPHSLPSLTFTSCSGGRDEIWFAAKEIQKLLDKDVLPSEIAVIARQIDPYFPALRDVFGQHQIPYVTSKPELANAHPALKKLRTDIKNSADKTMGSWAQHMAWAKTFLHDGPLHDALEESLLSLAILDHLNQPVTRLHFIAVWEEKLETLEMPGLSAHSESVQVLDAQQARGLRFKAVFLIGLNEKTFPRVIREDPFLSDAARGHLAQALGARLSRKLDGYQEERMLFELMRQTADDALFLSWQRSDEEGKTVIPAIYVRELLRAQHAKPARLPRSYPEKLKERAASTLTPKELSFLLNRAGANPDALYTALGWNSAQFDQLLKAHRATESFRPGILALDGKIERSAILKTILSKGYSPSGLEDLAECPYKFYSRHVLRIHVPDLAVLDGQITPSGMGKLFHRTLELYFKATQALKLDKQQLSTACAQAFDEFLAASPAIYPLIIKSSKLIVYQYLSIYLESDLEECKSSGFVPSYPEQNLDSAVTEFGEELSHVQFRGRVDRIDLKQAEGHWVGRVVDYKSGHARAAFGKLETALIQGKYLQLPIYMGLARRFLEVEKGKAVALEGSTMRWLRSEDQGEPEPYLTPAFWQTPAAKLFIENIKELSKLSDNGHFHIVPSTGDWGHCSRCDFGRICRKEHMPTRARAVNDPVAIANRERLSRTAKS